MARTARRIGIGIHLRHNCRWTLAKFSKSGNFSEIYLFNLLNLNIDIHSTTSHHCLLVLVLVMEKCGTLSLHVTGFTKFPYETTPPIFVWFCSIMEIKNTIFFQFQMSNIQKFFL